MSTTQSDPARHLEIYLQDHHAAGRAGSRLATRITRNISTDIEGCEQLRQVAADVADDLRTLENIMQGLGVRPSRAKDTMMMTFEMLGRLKLNGSIRKRSRLSDVEELETLLVGITGKAALWASLGARTAQGGMDSPTLIERAHQQAEIVTSCRERASTRAFDIAEPARAAPTKRRVS